MAGKKPITKTPYSRTFLIEDGAGPANTPLYMAMTRAMAFDWPQGDVTPIRIPDPDVYNQFIVIDEIKGAQGLPSLPVQSRYPRDLSDLFRIVRKGCSLDLQVHIGACYNPQDFDGGWEKVLVLETARPTGYTTSELGALDQGEDAAVNEDVPFTGRDAYELKRLLVAEVAKTEVVQEIVAVAICDSKQCGACGIPTDGCQKLFAIEKATVASPGMAAELIFSADGGAVWGETNVLTLAANQDPSDIACVGIYLVVISNGDCSLHYAELADILAGTEIWTEVTTGLVCPAGAPNAIFSISAAFSWLVGDGGYIYFSSDPTAGVSVQSAGIATTEDLLDIHGCDELNLVAVGGNGAVVYTENGGDTWAAASDSPAAVDLNTVWVVSKYVWWVGASDGRLWYTRDAGVTWTEKAFNGSGTGEVQKIWFSTPTVGYLAHTTAAPKGRILRTINGGYSWYVLPEGAATFPGNDAINDVVGCGENPNFVFGGGLSDVSTDGFAVIAS